MIYRESKDGIPRVTINLKLRLSKQDFVDLEPLAKDSGYTSVIKWIRDFFPVAWRGFVADQHENLSDDFPSYPE